MPGQVNVDDELKPRLARLVSSGLCMTKDVEKHQKELAELIERTSGSRELRSEATFFKALADETRLKMVYALLAREMCECEVMAALHMTQPTASHHLSILQRARIVERRKKGKWVFYSATPVPTKAVLDALKDLRS